MTLLHLCAGLYMLRGTALRKQVSHTGEVCDTEEHLTSRWQRGMYTQLSLQHLARLCLSQSMETAFHQMGGKVLHLQMSANSKALSTMPRGVSP